MEQRKILSSGSPRLSALNWEDIARALKTRPARRPGSDVLVSQNLAAPAALSPGDPIAPLTDSLTPAAVLVPLVERDEGLQVLLTQRTAHLANHGGQISFPGGRMEGDDADATDAALRETTEEIGLTRDHVSVLGRLDDYVTITGFLVTPVVGHIRPPFSLVPDPFEVDEIFEVPLSFILNPANHQRHSRVNIDGRTRYHYAIPYGERYIWGATAAMLVNLYEVLTQPCAS